MSVWELETARARLSEIVRQAREEGPQTITIGGAEAAVMVSTDDFRRLSACPTASDWVDTFRTSFTGEVDFDRDRDVSRDVER